MYRFEKYVVLGGLCMSMGCTAENSDWDFDGLRYADEITLGTEPGKSDTDGDGINDGDEYIFGTDPTVVDSDGDGLDDGVEDANQNAAVDDGETDPREFDTDGDTYGDGLELDYGTDPTDFDDRIYEGFWPYNPNKDDIDGVSMGDSVSVGDIFPSYSQKDQFKERVELYDFAGHGKMVILDFSTQWCPPCNSLASFLDGTPGTGFTYTKIRKAINQGDLYWITLLEENNSYNAPGVSTSSSWYNLYPHEHIPVFADKQQKLYNYAYGWWPSFMLLNEDMSVEMMETDAYQVLDYVESIL